MPLAKSSTTIVNSLSILALELEIPLESMGPKVRSRLVYAYFLYILVVQVLPFQLSEK